MIFRFSVSIATIMLLSLTAFGQSEKFAAPNEFHSYVPGKPLPDSLKTNKKLVKHSFPIPFTNIITRGMIAYSLSGQLTEANDKIDVDLFFYHNLLSVIRVVYKAPQSRDIFMKALTAKYGPGYQYGEKVYSDPANATSIENQNWKSSACCILSFLSSGTFDKVSLIFADKDTQTKLKAQQLTNSEKKID